MNVVTLSAVFLLLPCLSLLFAFVGLWVQNFNDLTTCGQEVTQLKMKAGRLMTERYKVWEDNNKLNRSILNLQQHVERHQNDTDKLEGSYSELIRTREEFEEQVLESSCCPADWRMFDKQCYFFSKSLKNWTESKLDCEQRGAQLVIISSTEQQNFISSFANSGWIGLSYVQEMGSGKWKWLNGTALMTDGWRERYPKNSNEGECAKSIAKFWFDLPCGELSPWICMKKPA